MSGKIGESTSGENHLIYSTICCIQHSAFLCDILLVAVVVYENLCSCSYSVIKCFMVHR